MEIIKLYPQGFCAGVFEAWRQTNEVIRLYPRSKIYMLGWVVHNEKLIESLHAHNVTILDDSHTSRLDLVKSVVPDDNNVFILSAHGTDYATMQYLDDHEISYVDTTCKFVYLNQHVVKQAIQWDDEQVLFIGKKNHPETKAIIANWPSVIVIETATDIEQLPPIDKNILVANQTTLSKLDFADLTAMIQARFPNKEIKFRNDICHATLDRQNAVINMDPRIQAVIVCGDARSNNANNLVKVCQASHAVPVYLVNDPQELDFEALSQYQYLGLTASASTPIFITRSIELALKQHFNPESVPGKEA